jgi:hypothetical protein
MVMMKVLGSLVCALLLAVVASHAHATSSGSSGYADIGAKQQFLLAKADFLADKQIFLNQKLQFLGTKAEYKAGNISKQELLAAKIDWIGSKIAFTNAKIDWLGVKQQYRGGSSNGAVPIPATFLLFGWGFAGLVAWRWKTERNS